MRATEERGPWATEAVDLVRAVSGGLLFGIPLLYTMEVWWIGTSTEPARMVAVLAATFLVVFLLNRTSGFRSTKDVRASDAAMDAVEAVALGLLSVTAILFLLREITVDTPMGEALGKITYEAMPFGIGIALAHHFLRRGRSAGDDEGEGEDEGGDDGGGQQRAEGELRATAADVAATVIGAVFVAFNIAPTDEVPMLAAALGPPQLLALVAVSLVVSFCIVFVAGFSNEEQRRQQQGILQHPVTETVACYLIALVVAAAMLWFFQRFDASSPWQESLSHVLVLGLPASVGGAAGRLAV